MSQNVSLPVAVMINFLCSAAKYRIERVQIVFEEGAHVMIKHIAVALLLGASAPAFAVVSPFGGAATGVDPLGHTWMAAGSSWGEPGLGLGTLTFNPLSTTGLGSTTYATSFSFTFLKGVSGVIDTTPSPSPFGYNIFTRFTNLTDGVAWDVSYSANEVTFTAPTMASKLDVGDNFFVNIAFTGPIDPKKFSFAGLWDEEPVTAVPEPATWAMLVSGFALLGASLRRRSRRIVSFA